jgi:hypothetical protein
VGGYRTGAAAAAADAAVTLLSRTCLCNANHRQ